MPTPASSFRINQQTKRTLERLARERGKSMSEMLELSILHLWGTLQNGQPVYMDVPPDEPKSHKKAKRVA